MPALATFGGKIVTIDGKPSCACCAAPPYIDLEILDVSLIGYDPDLGVYIGDITFRNVGTATANMTGVVRTAPLPSISYTTFWEDTVIPPDSVARVVTVYSPDDLAGTSFELQTAEGATAGSSWP